MIEKRTFSSSTTTAACYTLANADLKVEILTYGARIRSIYTKDKFGELANVVLGYDTLEEYEQDSVYFGAFVGRCAGRIEKGTFTLHDKTYPLAVNNGCNHLHGGNKGFSFQVFDATCKDDRLYLTYTSSDMEEGYPGTLKVQVIYWLDKESLHMEYHAQSDQDTIVNFTNHSYFNLLGAGNGEVDQHLLRIQADNYYPNDAFFLPSQAERVVNTPFDFREFHKLQDIFQLEHPQLHQAHGIDHYFRFRKVHPQVEIYEPQTGRYLIIDTDQSGAQCYTPYYETPISGKAGKRYGGRAAICIETQRLSNSINRGPCEVLLRKGEVYTHHTTFTFRVKEDIQ